MSHPTIPIPGAARRAARSWHAATLLLAGACAASVHAHVTLDQPSALAGSTYKAVLRVGHGCEGSATHTVTVRLPVGFRGAKPMPKAGWALTLQREALASPEDGHSRLAADAVVEVTWEATAPAHRLQDGWYDEFTVRGRLPAQPGLLWFKVRQGCEKGELAWVDVPAEGRDTRGLKAPAALLEVLPNEAHTGHAH